MEVPRNKILDKCMSAIPQDPITQSQYMYYLTMVLFLGLLGFTLSSVYGFYVMPTFKSFFTIVFMFAATAMTLFSLKSTRAAYLMALEFLGKKEEPKEESVDTMIINDKTNTN